jgi:WD40 repeat protein
VHDDSIRALTYSHNGQALVSADKTGMIKYFTPHLTNVHGFQGHREACHGVSWSPNDERFVSCGDDGLVKIWDYREGLVSWFPVVAVVKSRLRGRSPPRKSWVWVASTTSWTRTRLRTSNGRVEPRRLPETTVTNSVRSRMGRPLS